MNIGNQLGERGHRKMPSEDEIFVTKNHLEDKLVGYVKFKFLITVLLTTIGIPVICTWIMVNRHAEISNHAGAVSNQQFTEFKTDYRTDMRDLKMSLNKLLIYNLRAKSHRETNETH